MAPYPQPLTAKGALRRVRDVPAVHQPLKLALSPQKGQTCLKEVLVMPVMDESGDRAAAAVWLDVTLGDLGVEEGFDWYRDGEKTGLRETALPRHEVISARLQYSRPLAEGWSMCLAICDPDGIVVLKLDTGPATTAQRDERWVLTLGTWIELKVLLPNGAYQSLGDAYPRTSGAQKPSGAQELRAMLTSASGMTNLIEDRLNQLRPSVERSLARPGVRPVDLLAAEQDTAQEDGRSIIGHVVSLCRDQQAAIWQGLVAASEAVAPGLASGEGD